MKFKVTRTYKQTVQVKQFEPVTSECAVEAKFEYSETQGASDPFIKQMAEGLQKVCKSQVEKDIKAINKVKVEAVINEIKPF